MGKEKKKKMENLIECKISRGDLKILYEKLCVDPDTEVATCDKCILRNIIWNAGNCERDLCFAIWHDDILNEPEGKFVPHL